MESSEPNINNEGRPLTDFAQTRFTEDDYAEFIEYIDSVTDHDSYEFPSYTQNDTVAAGLPVLAQIGYRNRGKELLAMYYIATQHPVWRVYVVDNYSVDSLMSKVKSLEAITKNLTWEQMIQLHIIADDWDSSNELVFVTYRRYYEILRAVREVMRHDADARFERYGDLWRAGVEDYTEMRRFVENDIDPHLASTVTL